MYMLLKNQQFGQGSVETVHLCSIQLWLGQLEGWELESLEVLFIQVSGDFLEPWLWRSVHYMYSVHVPS